MHSQILYKTLLFTTFVASGMAGVAQNTNVYLKNIAPGHLDRLAKYRTDNAGKLTNAQAKVLAVAEGVVKDAAVDKAPSVEKACAAAFDKSTCSFILTGRPTGTEAKRSMLDKRARCECADASDYCASKSHCQYKSGNCAFTDKGCGTFGLYVCNGMCVPN